MKENILQNKRILILEDELDVSNSLKLLFEAEGAKVFVSDYAYKAVSIAKKEIPDLCIFDVMLPDESGLQLYAEFKTHPYLSKIPIIFVTGVNSFELGNTWTPEKISTEYGVPPPEGFIEKPFNPTELLNLVCDILLKYAS